MGAHDRGQTFAPRPPEHRAERIQKREIRLACAVLLDAAATRHEQTRTTRARAPQKLIRQRSLADARLTGNEDDSSVTFNRLAQESFQLCQFRLATDE